MIASQLPRARFLLIYAGFYLMVAAVLARTFNQLTFSDAAVVAGGVGLFVCIALARDSGRSVLSRRPALYLSLQTAITASLLALEPSLDFLALLFVLLSLQAVLLLPQAAGYFWLLGFGLLTAGLFFVFYAAGDAIPFILIYCGAYVFFGVLAKAVVESEAARATSEGLLAELREKEARLRLLVTDAPVVLIGTDDRGELILAEGQALRALGIEANPRSGQHMAQVFSEAPGLVTALEQALEGADSGCTVELRGRVFEFCLSPRKDGLGGVIGVIGVGSDVTEREQREAALRELAVSEERNRLAREIHDTLAQGFTGIVLQLEAAEESIDDAPREAASRLARAKSLARESLQEARRSVWNLLPRALEDRTVEEALRDEVRRFAAEGQERTSFSVRGERVHLAAEVQTALLRVCQESLTNVRKHAAATEVSVTLSYEPDSIRLQVLDNGVGLNSSAGRSGEGRGLAGMEERAQILGGRFRAEKAESGGTRVLIEVPLAGVGAR